MAASALRDDPVSAAVVYLDIDGVLQPTSSQERFEHDMKALKQSLVEGVDPGYAELNRYDIAAVRYDWHPVAIANLKTLCARGRAKIVVSSSWREDRTLDQLRLLFRIHELDALIIGQTPLFGARDQEILEHLTAHPEIQRFVIVDDSFADTLGGRFPRHYVRTDRYLDAEALDRALAALRRRRTKKEATLLDAFDALSRCDPALTRLELDLEAIGILRRRRGLTKEAFWRVVFTGVEASPGLTSLVIHGMEHELTYDELKKEKLVDRLRETAARNPSLRHVEIDAGRW